MTRRQKGMTLVELLVALLVFSFVAAASVFALRLGVDARDQLGDADARLSRLQTAGQIMREDFAAIVDRPVRDEFGETLAPFRGGRAAAPRPLVAEERVLVAFVRGGWINPQAQAPRSELQYVEYLLRGGDLLRRTRPYLDDARGQPRSERVLIESAGEATLRFLSGETSRGLDWAEEWPLPIGGGVYAPRAIALEYASPRYGAIRHLFWTGAAARAPTGAAP